jgi:hypothetical protein
LVVRQYSATTGAYGQFNIPSLTGYRPISIETSDLMCLGIQNSGLLDSYSATLVTLDANGKYMPSANNTIYINVVYAKI